jgi:hypothetical protein
MTGFDFVFALFSLVLGLAVAEVLGGFGGVMKLHARARAGRARDVRVGWLVPMLAALVVLNQLSFWMMAYSMRETLPFGYLTLLGVLIVVGAYYLFAVIVFPDDPSEWPDFDLYYDQHNRLILGGMLAINLAGAVVVNVWAPKLTAVQLAARAGTAGTIGALGVFAALGLMLTLIFVRNRRLNIVLLAMLIVATVGGAAMVAVSGL